MEGQGILNQPTQPSKHMGVSENVVYPFLPNGFADHHPVFKWLFHWEYTLFSDKPIFFLNDLYDMFSWHHGKYHQDRSVCGEPAGIHLHDDNDVNLWCMCLCLLKGLMWECSSDLSILSVLPVLSIS